MSGQQGNHETAGKAATHVHGLVQFKYRHGFWQSRLVLRDAQ